MILTVLITTVIGARLLEGAVLDPALFLAPSPPLRAPLDSPSPGDVWTRSLEESTERIRATRDVELVGTEPSSTEPISEARMFWPRYSPPQPALGVHVPLTFSLSGSYGNVASVPASVIGNTYTSVSGLGSGFASVFGKAAPVFGSYGRTSLAGVSYGSYGTGSVRVYGGDNAASWSGWGNGKWGNYGKG